jgi:hypothetical protein
LVQGWATASTGSGTAASLDVTWGSPATTGSLLLVAANSDATLSISGGGGGWTLAASAVNSQGAYLWYKVAAGGETSVTLTPSITDVVCGAVGEYSAVTVLDVQASNTRTSLADNIGTGTTGTTAQNVELVVCVAGPHQFAPEAPPTSPGWVIATNRAAVVSNFATGAQNAALFVGDYVTGATGAQSETCTWTTATTNAGGIIAAFE